MILRDPPARNPRLLPALIISLTLHGLLFLALSLQPSRMPPPIRKASPMNITLTPTAPSIDPAIVQTTDPVVSPHASTAASPPIVQTTDSVVSLTTLTPLKRLAVPPYPETARRLGYEGTVVLRFTVRPSGRVDDVTVISNGAPELLVESCLRTVRRWRFTPGAEPVVTEKTFIFQLNN